MNFRLVDYPFEVGQAAARLRLKLRRFIGAGSSDGAASGVRALGAKPAVLMLHGGNTSSDTFILPEGGLAQHLFDAGFDPWLLEWRASPYVVWELERRAPLGGSEREERRLYTMDTVVEEDIPGALGELRRYIGDVELSLIGHCLGGGALSLATARGKLAGFDVANVVLSTLGLFYEVPETGWIKAEDFLLERVLFTNPRCRNIDPHDDQRWPEPFRQAFEHWPRAWLPPGGNAAARMLQRLTFMFGQPYAAEALHPSLSGPVLQGQFGPMQLGLYQHMGQMVRRGYAAPFDALDVIDRPRAYERTPRCGPDRARANAEAKPSDLVPEPFVGPRFTLIAAAENTLWHRDSIDLMYEWLRSIDCDGRRVSCKKRVFAGYRIQELLWGKHAKREVYPAYLEGVSGRGAAAGVVASARALHELG